MRITKKHVLSFLILFTLVFGQIFILSPLSSPAQADKSLVESQTGLAKVGLAFGEDGKTAPTDLRIIIAKVVNVLLGFLSIVFLVLILVAGYRYMMAGGNDEKTLTSRSQIKNAIIGLAITLGAWTISRWVLLRLRAAVENRVDLFYPL